MTHCHKIIRLSSYPLSEGVAVLVQSCGPMGKVMVVSGWWLCQRFVVQWIYEWDVDG